MDKENCCQGLGEYGQVICQGLSHHLSIHIINVVQSHFFHCFPCLVLVDQEGECVHYDCLYYEYDHMGFQSGLSLLLENVEELLPEEGLYFWMYLYFCWSILDLIYVCDCSKSVVLWVTLNLCIMVLWRDNFLVCHNVIC